MSAYNCPEIFVDASIRLRQLFVYFDIVCKEKNQLYNSHI